MTERVTETPSGLLLVEHVPDPPPPAPVPTRWCRVCGAPHPPGIAVLFGWRTPAGWSIHKPCCRHPGWLECPACEAAPEPPFGPGRAMTPEREAYFAVRNCPVCGDDCELT